MKRRCLTCPARIPHGTRCKACERRRLANYGPDWKQTFRPAVIAKARREGKPCGICGDPVPRGDESVDHIRPLAEGGTTTFDNLQLVHKDCNSRKGKR